MAAHRGGGGSELGGFVERADLDLVGEEDVDMAIHQLAEIGAVAFDAERVGERQRDLATLRVGDLGGLAKRLLRQWRVEEIAFEIGYLRRAHDLGVDVAGPQFGAGAQIRSHRALAVGGDEDQAARGAGAVGRRRRLELNPLRAEVMAEDLSQQIVAHLADKGAAAAERGEASHRVGGRPARRLDRRPHPPVERLGALGVNQGHRPLDQPLFRQKVLLGMGDHIDDRIADADNIDRSSFHLRLRTSTRATSRRLYGPLRLRQAAPGRVMSKHGKIAIIASYLLPRGGFRSKQGQGRLL